jgi:hypothetical protein
VNYAVVKILEKSGGKRRVKVVRRDDGIYGLMAEFWYRSEWEGKLLSEGWKSFDGPHFSYASFEIAEREAPFTYTWLNAPGYRVDDGGNI